MQQWFVTYAVGALDARKTFEADADTKAEAMALGDTLAAAWLRLHGMAPGDLRADPSDGNDSAAGQLVHCAPVPPAWVGIFGRRAEDGNYTRVTTAPVATAILEHHGAVPPPWNLTEDLPWRLDLRRHSPTGLEWGYLGSGPAQLAIAACAFALGDERSEKLYQAIKERLFAGIQNPEWVVTVGRLRELAEEIERQREAQGIAVREKGGSS